MIQIILEFLAWIGLDYADYKHRKGVRKKEKVDGIQRPFQKYILQPSSKIVIFVLVLACLTSLLFFTYQRSFIFPERTEREVLEISDWIKKWNEKYGEYPKELKEVIGNNPMRKHWDKDAWNRDYKYIVKESQNAFWVISAGKDGQFGTEDDISSK